jgi:anti-sigma-K factor RskA
MNPLSNTDREMILDYCLGQLSDAQVSDIEELIRTSPEAAQLHESIKSSLQPLSTAELLEPCPDALAELTVARLVRQSRSDTDRLQQLISEERERTATIKVPLWHRATQIVAVAAVVLFALSIAMPILQRARAQSYQARCSVQLGSIGQAMFAFRNDNGQMPVASFASGASWWQVGNQGIENHSNTRSVWMLASQGYVDPEKFICPGRLQTMTPPEFENMAFDRLRDFPNKSYLNYSPLVCCEKNARVIDGKTIIMADNNPLCEGLPEDYTQGFQVRLDGELMQANSRNHDGQGQNLLAGDGSVTFATSRLYGPNRDDVYTLASMSPGEELNGCEVPACSSDIFLAP